MKKVVLAVASFFIVALNACKKDKGLTNLKSVSGRSIILAQNESTENGGGGGVGGMCRVFCFPKGTKRI